MSGSAGALQELARHGFVVPSIDYRSGVGYGRSFRGADLAGVHLYGNVIDSTNLAFRSSAAGAIDGWKSPVFLVHGDDDRTVDFAQTVGLVQLLRARGVYHELIVVPDDLHESMLHSKCIETFERMGAFLRRFD